MTSLPPFVLTRTANMRHLPAAWLDGAGAWQVMCNVSLEAFDPCASTWPVEWYAPKTRARVEGSDRLPECSRCRRRAIERESGRSAGRRSTVGWGAESRSERPPIPVQQNGRNDSERGAQGAGRLSREESANG